MRRVTFSIQNPDGDWHQVGAVTDQQPPGSIGTTDDEGRDQVYVFGWLDGQGPAIWRSKAGVDITSPLVRLITSVGLELVADLDSGPHEMTWRRPVGEALLRFEVAGTQRSRGRL